MTHLCCRPMTAPQMSRCDQGHKGGTAANHAMSGGVNTRWVGGGGKPKVQIYMQFDLLILIVSRSRSFMRAQLHEALKKTHCFYCNKVFLFSKAHVSKYIEYMYRSHCVLPDPPNVINFWHSVCMQGQPAPAGGGPGHAEGGDGRAHRPWGVPAAPRITAQHLHRVLQTLRTTA